MLDYFLSLGHMGRILCVIGILSFSTLIICIFIDKLEDTDRGVHKRSGPGSIKHAMSVVCVFAFVTLFLSSKGVSWYMAYPASVLVTLVYFFTSLLLSGSTVEAGDKKFKVAEIDYRLAIGHIGLVYKTVTPDMPTGCVSVDVFGRTIDAFALSADDVALPVGAEVKVIDADGSILICRLLESLNG